MTILRSREVPSSIEPKPRRPKPSDEIEPATPVRTQESTVHRSPVTDLPPPLENNDGGTNPVDENSGSRRRSVRLAYQRDGDVVDEKEVSVCRKRKSNDSVGERVLSLRSGKKVAVKVGKSHGFEIESRNLKFNSELYVSDSDSDEDDDSKQKSSDPEEVIVSNKLENSETDKGKAVVMAETDNADDDSLPENMDKGKGVAEDSYDGDENPSSSVGRRKYTWEEKGKEIKVDNVASPPINDEVEIVEEDNSINNDNLPEVVVIAPDNAAQAQNNNGNQVGNGSRTSRFLDFAKRNAHRFAHFDPQMDEDDEEDLSDNEIEQDVEDWPGPFSTARKIIQEREENAFHGINTHVFNQERPSTISWTPKGDRISIPLKAPSLQELSLRELVKNADAIASLDYIPDVLRCKLTEMLCDSRRMNARFLDLLVRGSPTEIRVPDCSWLTEEQFTEYFKSCDTSSLTVLQLDQAGQCMPDYVLHSTLASSRNNLLMLSSLSLTAAYRLSDVGLRALVSAAPAISSINLSQCSLLTSSSIDMLADSLGSVLKELYINECQNIDMKLILPALKKFEELEVLSLADLSSVKGRFLREFVACRGQTLKQLILTNSSKLTDASIKAISEHCPNLTVLDLSNVCKLTDSALGYLATGCQSLEKLVFCRNSFSDETIAAFVETASGSLKELSLNNVKKVSNNTALALGKYAKQLEILDVSWCRDMSNDSLGYIVDNCPSLKVFKVFGCTQITDVFVGGHSNPNVKIIGLKMDPFLDNLSKERCL